jgi:hypothetical protein
VSPFTTTEEGSARRQLTWHRAPPERPAARPTFLRVSSFARRTDGAGPPLKIDMPVDEPLPRHCDGSPGKLASRYFPLRDPPADGVPPGHGAAGAGGRARGTSPSAVENLSCWARRQPPLTPHRPVLRSHEIMRIRGERCSPIKPPAGKRYNIKDRCEPRPSNEH